MQSACKPQQYYLKSKTNHKEPSKNLRNPAQQTQISLILNKMNSKSKIDSQLPSSERATKPSLQTSPKMSHYLSSSNLISKTTSSPKYTPHELISKRQSKECPSRISNEESQLPIYFNNLMEMEERRRQLDSFKEKLNSNQKKISQLQQLQIQTDLIETQLLAVVKSIQLLKDQLQHQLLQESQSCQTTLAQVQESMKKMQDDILFNEQNIIDSMQMKPFLNIMTIYQKRVDEHGGQLNSMIQRRQQIIQFNTSCQTLLMKMQGLLDPKSVFASFGSKLQEKENLPCKSNLSESPCFKQRIL